VARAGMVRWAQAHSEDAEEGARGKGGEGRQNHPAVGYSHPLDEATDCDGVPPSSISTSSSFSSSSSSSSSSCFCSSAVVVVPLPSPSPCARRYSSLLPPPTSSLQNDSR
jgi:hypothetical protein